ncbi:MAG: tail fiber protein [Pseudomonadota bacterium]
MTEPFIAEIRIVGFNFAPRGWALCQGQLLPIAQNTALFSLLGTMYGGNGTQNFALPNLSSRVPVASGQGPGLSAWVQGQQTGTSTETLLPSQMPAHTHPLNVSTSRATTTDSSGNQLANGLNGTFQAASQVRMYSPNGVDTVMAPQSLSLNGGSQPHNNQMPHLALYYCIALQGIFPQRN